MRQLAVAVLGAAGAVGGQIVRSLEERGFPVGSLKLLGTEHSAGAKVAFGSEELTIEAVSERSFASIDLVFMAATTAASRQYAPLATAAGAVVIDKSNAFRMDPDVPLVVPEVNPSALTERASIIASPNCSTIQLVVVLKPIQDACGLRRVIVSTYQAVSGSGRDAIDELMHQTADLAAGQPARARFYPRQIAQNVLPHIDDFDAAGHSAEELKLVNETRRILGAPGLPITATAVRVPVVTGHAESVYLETEQPLTACAARNLIARAPGVVVMDQPRAGVYPTPLDAAGRDEVFVGRIRADTSDPRGLNLWIVADNLRKGAATNAIQIAELMLARGLLPRGAGRCES